MESLQVVKLSKEPGKRYDIDEEALASVLLRPDVRNLPVVVVSVAGAYRGGKSFILGYFLRYLGAERASQISSDWLGNENEALKGFNWRGGGEANTKGIHIWPEPIIVNIESTGEKVAVLLMDTQGTFDSESDMGDNSTIFALSTLLSSVQIYNLRANIGEDDLQHLQLFTEYGKLASDGEGRAFQTLLFLVRDWMSPYEHKHGFGGGEALLNLRLIPVPSQRPQCVEVREHIRSCFDKLQCFLMPHPGLSVANEGFRGCLSDITEQFKEALLELVPSIFDPDNLTRKLINGDHVQAQSLLEYFKQYVDIFNSEDLPEPTTIFQATSDAFLTSALRQARQFYEDKMGSNISEDQSVTMVILEKWHKIAVEFATEKFKGKKKLGLQDKIESRLGDLVKELEERFCHYQWQNDIKLREKLALCKQAYEGCVAEVCAVSEKLCLNDYDLSMLNQNATASALEIFDLARTEVPRAEDQDRNKLIEDFEQKYQKMCYVNEQNNSSAIFQAREVYTKFMKDNVPQCGVSGETLQKIHDNGLANAIKHFQSFRNKKTKETEDSYLEKLEQDVMSSFHDFESTNKVNNIRSIEVAVAAYNNQINKTITNAYHPRALDDIHKEAEKYAFSIFQQNREESFVDEFKDKLKVKLQERYNEVKETNNNNNHILIDQAVHEYRRHMEWHTQAVPTDFLLIPYFIRLGQKGRHHNDGRDKAINFFKNRRSGPSYPDDHYLNDLESKISAARHNY